MQKDKHFDKLVKFLENSGYKVVVSSFVGTFNNSYRSASAEGNGVIAGFGEVSNVFYRHVSGKIAADNEHTFDKWSKCPVNLPIPVNDEQRSFLLKKLEWLATDEGHQASNEYSTDKWVTEYEQMQ